jgi:asparagine synthase (glutamine-hydrolysing)
MCGIWGYIQHEGIMPFYKLFESFMKIQGRGPESYSFNKLSNQLVLGFHRLAINGLSGSGNQPFIKEIYNMKTKRKETIYAICNGEIYNYREIIETHNFNIQSGSDCEVIPYLYMKYGESMIKYLDGEFAFIIIVIDNDTNEFKLFCGRDPFGVRPLFYGYHDSGLVFGSELKSIIDLCDNVNIFPPGNIMTYDNKKNKKYINESVEFKLYYEYEIQKEITINIFNKIVEIFTRSIQKRLVSERQLGCLLSGGLDSSIVSAITSKLVNYQLNTFTIGLEGATDIKYAELVAKHIGSNHRTFVVTIEEALEAIKEVVYNIESYDCTSVRASVWQYLLGKKISEETDIKVLLTGEGSDELTSGYLYFHKAPNEQESHLENIRLLKDIHRFDGLRVDRAMSCHGLEVRIPFLDPEFVKLYLALPKNMRMASYGIEKQLFRDAFKNMDILPQEVLYRKKEAFSDGTSSNDKSWFQIIQEYVDNMISDEEFENNKDKYIFNRPDTKEKYYYRKIFEEKFGKKSEEVIPYYWLPKWCGDIKEPSARILEVYNKK